MARSRSTFQDAIRAECEDAVATSVNGDHYGAYEAFAAMQHRSDFSEIGPLMAEAFIDIILRGCREVGAVTGVDLPDISRFLPDERKSVTRLRDAVPGMTGRDMVKVRRIHRTNVRAALEMVETYATQGPEPPHTLFEKRAAIHSGTENLLVMLWGTAISVQRHVREADAEAGDESGQG